MRFVRQFLQVIRREYLEQMVEKAKSMELVFGSDYPYGISKWLQDLMRKVARMKKTIRRLNHELS